MRYGGNEVRICMTSDAEFLVCMCREIADY